MSGQARVVSRPAPWATRLLAVQNKVLKGENQESSTESSPWLAGLGGAGSNPAMSSIALRCEDICSPGRCTYPIAPDAHPGRQYKDCEAALNTKIKSRGDCWRDCCLCEKTFWRSFAVVASEFRMAQLAKRPKSCVEGYLHEVSAVLDSASRIKYFTTVLQEATSSSRVVVFQIDHHHVYVTAEKYQLQGVEEKSLADILADPVEYQRVDVTVKVLEERERETAITRANKTLSSRVGRSQFVNWQIVSPQKHFH
ncbi:hypothetical protein SRHO_G00080480 [Serrasalmus rhombeus]